jgi:hypothetical protein
MFEVFQQCPHAALEPGTDQLKSQLLPAIFTDPGPWHMPCWGTGRVSDRDTL